MKKKFAFTLAEVLITLGIIGVVAAITMPALTEKINNIILVNKLKKMYSVLSQAMMYTVVRDGDFNSLSIENDNLTSIENWYKNTLKPQLKITKECIDEAGCWAKGVKTLGGQPPYSNCDGIGIGDDIIIFTTADGYNVLIDAYNYNKEGRFGIKPQNGSTSDYLVVFVDVNGNQNPNIVGKDIFMFVFTPDRGFVPAGRDESDDVINNNCSIHNQSNEGGYYCFEKIIRNNWQISKNFYD